MEKEINDFFEAAEKLALKLKYSDEKFWNIKIFNDFAKMRPDERREYLRDFAGHKPKE